MSQALIACFDENFNPLPLMTRFEAYDTEGVYYGIAEEAGIIALPDALYLVAEASSETYKAHYKNYAFLFSGSIEDLSFPDQEVSEAQWMTMDTYSAELALHPEQWCNSCNKERQQIILNWLARK